MKNTLIALILMISASTVIAGDWYAQGGAGITKYDFSGASEDQEGTNYFGAIGYIFDNNLGLEGEYEYVSNADLSSGTEINETNNYTVYGVGRVPLDHKDKVNLVLKAGIGYTDIDMNIKGARNPSDNSWYPAFGGGVEWMITDSVGVLGLIDYKSFDFSTGGSDFSADPISYKLGIQYKF